MNFLAKVYPIRERVLGQVVADKAALHGQRTFIRFEEREVSYAVAAKNARMCWAMLKLGDAFKMA